MNTRRALRLLLIFSVVWAPAVASAKPDSGSDSTNGLFDLSLEELGNVTVTTASRTEQKLDEAPGSLTVITRQQIVDSNARTLRDVLNMFVPGLDVVPAYFRYGDRVNEGIYSRGLLSDFSQQVLILFNGKGKFNESTWGSPFTAIEFTLENIEQIEVSRSPIPLYGGSAITTINLITRDQKIDKGVDVKVSGSTGARQSDLSAKNASVIFKKELEDVRLSGSVQVYDDKGQAHPAREGQGGYSLDPGDLRDGTRSAVNATLSVATKDNLVAFQTWFKTAERDPFLSALVPSPNTEPYKYEGTAWLSDLTIRPLEDVEVTLGYQWTEWNNIYDFGGPGGGGETNYDTYVEASYLKAVGDHSLLAGIKLEREAQKDGEIVAWDGRQLQDTGDKFAPDDARNVYSVYAEDSWKFADNWVLLGGARFDHFSGFGNKTDRLVSPRFAVSNTSIEHFIFKALYASAPRPPSIYERSGTGAVPLAGSRDVKAERVDSFELSTTYKNDSFRFEFTPFYQVFSDKIEYVPNADNSIFTAQNNGKTTVFGADIVAWYYFNPRHYIFVNASLFDSHDEERGNDTYFVADRYFNAGYNWGLEKLNLNVNLSYRGERQLPPELVINSDSASRPHFFLNSSMSYMIQKDLRLFVLIENLTNRTNSVPLSSDGLFVPERGRTVTVGVNLVY